MHCWSFMLHRKYAIGCLYLLLCPLQQTFLLFICPGVRSQITIRSLVPNPSIADPYILRSVDLLYFIQLRSFWWSVNCLHYELFMSRQAAFCRYILGQFVGVSGSASRLLQCLPRRLSIRDLCWNIQGWAVNSSEWFSFLSSLSPLSALWVKSRNSSMQCTYLRTSLTVQPRLAPGSSSWWLSIRWFTGVHHCVSLLLAVK